MRYMNKKKERYIRFNIQFFAKDGAGGEKTENATAKKLQDARREGQVAKSVDMITAGMLLTLFLALKFYIDNLGNDFIKLFRNSYRTIHTISTEEFTINSAQTLVVFGLKEVMGICAPIFISAMAVAFSLNIAQVKWKPTTRPLKPSFGKFNPLNGVKRMISKDKVMELLKSTLKIIIIAYIVYGELKKQWSLLMEFYHISLNQAIMSIGKIAINLGVKISLIFMFIGCADYIYQKLKFKKDMKMTKQEVKDEYKQSEGDPQVKSKIRSKMREVSQRRMMQALPEADVVITNPTHLAVAVKYDRETAGAPIVIAKGADYLAEKIKDAARENQIEIVENKPLARMLYYNVDIDSEIPQELYQTVAEVLAYVYGLKGKL